MLAIFFWIRVSTTKWEGRVYVRRSGPVSLQRRMCVLLGMSTRRVSGGTAA
jgi:hypothetical protein